MERNNPSIDWLSDLHTFAVNRLPAHSDHTYYNRMEEAEQFAPMNLRYSLNGSWRFHYAVNPASRPEAFFVCDYDCSGWDEIEVPGHIQLQDYGQPQYVNTQYPWDGHEMLRPPAISEKHNAVGSYVKEFVLPDHMQGRPIHISFQGVESAFYVWLNGEFIGYSEDSFTPAEFELTSCLQQGKNKLAVEVYQRSTGSWLEDQDFWRFSGIFRDVYVYAVPEVHVYDLGVRTDLNETYSSGELFVDMKLIGETPSRISYELRDAVDRQVAVGDGMHDAGQVQISCSLDQLNLWSAELPYLYTLFIKLYNKSGELVEVVPQRIGFRKFEMIDKIMHLNGKRIVFKGVNRHEFNCRSGRAVTKEDMLWDIQTLKKNNINAVRTSHYPNQSFWYELCDLYGVYVIDEMNLETHGSWQKMGAIEPSWVVPGDKPEWLNIVMDRAVSMLERDKNHPSILIWSCGNESFGGEVIYQVSQYFRERDPSRLVHYEGVFHDRRFHETSDMESRMYAKPADIEMYLQQDPQKPYISCEYMHAMGNSLGGMHKYTALEEKYPMYQGGFIWDYIDQALVKKDRYGKEFLAYGGDYGDRATDYHFCGNGLVFADRQLTPKMQEVKHLYADVKLVPDLEGIQIRNQHLFKDTSEYKLIYSLQHEGKTLFQDEMEVTVGAGVESYIPLPVSLKLHMKHSGEYTVDAALRLKAPTLWAEAGHEIAFGQLIMNVEGAGATEQQDLTRGRLQVIHGDVNVGVHGTDFHAMFSKQIGSLTSLNYAGKEMIAAPPMPLFWRATTDNDKGTGMGFENGAWYGASLAPKCIQVEVNEASTDEVTIRFTYKLNIHEQVRVHLAYTVYGDGRIRVISNYEGATGLPDMPIFAVSFKLPADYDQLDWYALGPEENYQDRCHGARLTAFHNQASDNITSYLMPQESGNRTGVRRVRICDESGTGISVKAPAESPVECNISPYTAFELEHAQHAFELPPVHYTVVTVAGRQMGVGGDDSWGAPVHEEYHIKSEPSLSFQFTIQRV